MKHALPVLLCALMLGVFGGHAMPAGASAPPAAIAVLGVEDKWLAAVAAHNPTALGKILAPQFVHITYRGAVRYREEELADVKKPKPYTQRTSEQTVDFVGAVAIVRGVNTIAVAGKTRMRLRYTDVYTKEDGAWRAVSAQETAIAP